MTRPKMSIMATPTPVKTTRLTARTSQATRDGFATRSDSATVKNQLIGIDAIIASPPQLVVTRAASSVVLARSREPDRLLKM